MGVPFGETVTLIRRTKTGEDDYGNDIYSATDVTVPGVVWAPAGSRGGVPASIEHTGAADMVTTNAQAYLPPGTTVTSVDRIRRENGDLYEVSGEPSLYRNPFTGTSPGPIVEVKRVTG
jgi:hypothetical protein